jgi:AAA15 family ATPase/GTPase
MPMFQFEPPTDLSDFILYAWRCMGKESPSIPDLKFFLSFRAKLMPPSKAQEIIDTALHEGFLINKNNILFLPDKLNVRQAEQERIEKERIQQSLMQQARKEKAQTTKTFNDYFREILPEEYKTKTFLIKLKDIKLEVRESAPVYVKCIINLEGEKPMEIVIDGKSSTMMHSCELLTPQYKCALKVCPHIGAIFRSLQKEHADLALNLIRSIIENKEKWRFT